MLLPQLLAACQLGRGRLLASASAAAGAAASPLASWTHARSGSAASQHDQHPCAGQLQQLQLLEAAAAWPPSLQQQQQQQQQQQPRQLHSAWQHSSSAVWQTCWRRRQAGYAGWAAQALRGLHHTRPGAHKNAPAPARRKAPEGARALPKRNAHITARSLMVIFPDGSKQVMDSPAALDAARALQLDLVEVNPRASPPVARLMKFGQLVEKAEAAEKARRQQERMATPKEMQFSAGIADHDLEVKLRKVAGWLDAGHRVQLVVKHGREQLAAAQEALDYIVARVASAHAIEAGAKQPQRRAVAVLVKPLPGGGGGSRGSGAAAAAAAAPEE